MARRRREDDTIATLFELAHLLPWKVSVGLAVLSFGGLHWYPKPSGVPRL